MGQGGYYLFIVDGGAEHEPWPSVSTGFLSILGVFTGIPSSLAICVERIILLAEDVLGVQGAQAEAEDSSLPLHWARG